MDEEEGDPVPDVRTVQLVVEFLAVNVDKWHCE